MKMSPKQIAAKIESLRARLHTSKTIYTIMKSNLECAHLENEKLRSENERLTIELLAATKAIKRIKAQYTVIAGELAKMEPWWQAQDEELARQELQERMPEHDIPSFKTPSEFRKEHGKVKREPLDFDLDDIPF